MIKFSPPAIIFINNDLSDQTLSVLKSQLFIDEAIDGYEFDQRLATNINYPTTVHLNNLRVLVIRNLRSQTNNNLADIVLFAKSGMVSLLKNSFGPPGVTLSIDKLYYTNIIYNNK